MSLRDQIHADLTEAIRSSESTRRDALRMLWNAIYIVEKREHSALDDAATIAVLIREIKTRRESIDAFRGGGRGDLAVAEEAALAVVTPYMPRPLSEAEIADLVTQGIAATGASTPRDLGKVMGWLSPRTKGRADGKAVSAAGASALAHAGGGGPA